MRLLLRSGVMVCASAVLTLILAAGAARHALAQATFVGVIPNRVSSPPSPSDCPGGTLLHFQFDDENHDNANHRGGWIGATVSNRDTRFYLCRVDGSVFRPISTSTRPEDHYAVLQLSASCPAGSTSFYRYWDHENDTRATSQMAYSGNTADFGPNDVTPDGNSYMQFCLFRNGSNPMFDFPNLGYPYGVFAAANFARARATGWVATDDEDDPNFNFMSEDVDARRIVSPTGVFGRNTTLYLAEVTPLTAPLAICRVSPDAGDNFVHAEFSSTGSRARGGRSIVSYTWSFSWGETASGPGPFSRGFDVGLYYAHLTITDSAGESSTSPPCTLVVRDPTITIPTRR